MRNILNCQAGVEDMDLTFSTAVDNYGMELIVDLIPDGRNIKVTTQNRQEFVDSYVSWYLTTSVKDQFDPFLKGFYKVVPIESIRVGCSSPASQQLRGHQAHLRGR